jgi:hypothetical protein
MSVHDGHHIAEEFEHEVLDLFGNAVVITHLEPSDDEISSHDINLDRVLVTKEAGFNNEKHKNGDVNEANS